MRQRIWARSARFVVLAMLLAPLQVAATALQPAGIGPLDSRQLAFSPVGVELGIEEYAGGFQTPVQLANAGDGSGRLFLSERAGRVWVIQDGVTLDEPFLDIRDIVRDEDGEQGFFAVAFHPNYSENGYFYAVYTKQPAGDNVLARFQVSADDPNQADPDSLFELIALEDRIPNHNGGDIAFGPDGYLYYGAGDEGGAGDPFNHAQNGQTLFGKMLRLDVDGGEPYSIPTDNPFVDDPDVRDEIWAMGLRNPWRYSFDSLTGDLYIGDVGQDRYEEVNFQPAGSPGGENYGWPIMEGVACYPANVTECDTEGLTLPILVYSQEGGQGVRDGCTVIGGYVYRGEAYPFMDGVYIFGDWCEGRIWAGYRDEADEWRMTELLNTFIMWTSFGTDEAGELYATDMLGGRVFRLVFSQSDEQDPPIISAIVPGGAIAGASGVDLTVRGAGFVQSSEAHWNGVPLPTAYFGRDQLVAQVPAELLAEAGQVTVTVVNPASGATSNVLEFLISENEFADPAFAGVWTRTDQLVADASVSRTWIWGPRALLPAMLEPYAEAPGGLRVVLYFDKARMEITDPAGDEDSPWHVTNGLLVVELMTGRMQVGDAEFWDRAPAAVNVAGDADDPQGVTYATLDGLRGAEPLPEDATITARLARDGGVTDDPSLAGFGVTAGPLAPETGHRTASVFWDFMNAEGMILDGDGAREDRLFPTPYYATGLPVAEAYWTAVRVGGEERFVLLQCFERRCLTYTPDNPEGWQVEAGNVGLHYYTWRYGE